MANNDQPAGDKPSLQKRLAAAIEYHQLAAAHFRTKKPDPAKVQTHDAYVETLREALERINKRERREKKEPNKPTLAELQHYGQSIGMPAAECRQCFRHYEMTGWTYGRAKIPIQKWTLVVDSWHERWQRERPRDAATQQQIERVRPNGKDQDPEGWRTFLETLKQPYVQFQYARDWMKTQFSKRP